MKVLFLIPARGGSKGIPSKNLIPVAGVPLVGRAVLTARHAAGGLRGARVVCSTDDPVIADVAREWGAEVPFSRPAALASDTARTIDVVRHALDALGTDFEAVVVLQPTSPLTLPEDVSGALSLFRAIRSPVVSVCQAEHPPEWHHRLDHAGRLVPVRTPDDAHQRQSFRPSYRPNGAVYVASPAQLRDCGFWTAETRGFVMPADRSVDIDTATDVQVAEAWLNSRPVPVVVIGGKSIGGASPCFVIAEAGVNHNGSLDLALRLIDAAADAGADAVKFQTFEAERVVSHGAPQAEYQKVNTGRVERQIDMIRRLQLSVADHHRIAQHSRDRGIMFLSSPFDEGSVDLLAELGVPAYKIGSGELTNHPFLAYVARQGKPLLISTGMSSQREVAEAVAVVAASGTPPFALLHCVSSYPVQAADCNLGAMATMRAAFGVPIGWSDHTLGTHVAVAAAALGASLVEKHYTLDRRLPGPDHRVSLEPHELAEMVRCVREAEAARGTGEKSRRPVEEDTARVARRSLFTTKDLAPGHRVRVEDLCALRPGTGIPPSRLLDVVGRAVARPVCAGSMLAEGDLE